MSAANPEEDSTTGSGNLEPVESADDGADKPEGENLSSSMFNPHAARLPLAMEPPTSFSIDAGSELPQISVQQPYVNPLAGMMGRPDPGLSTEEKRNAYSEMMKSFQVGDLKAPLEKKSYWSSETGPVRRDDFNEYKEWAEDQIRQANGLTLEATSAMYKQERELAKEKLLREQVENKAASQPVSEPGALNKWFPKNGGKLRKPTYWNPDDEEEREAERSQFLYSNRTWQMKELLVMALLLRAKVAVERRDSYKTLGFTFEAQKIIAQLNFLPLESKCEFWVGRAEFSLGSYEAALAAFQKAMHCHGMYREGLEVKEWIEKTEKALRESPEMAPRAKPLRSRTRPAGFFGAGEHPPRFDIDEDESDEGEKKRPPSFAIDEDESDEGEKKRPPRFDIDEDEFDDGKKEHPPRFPLDDDEEFEAGKGNSSDDDDQETIQRTMGNIEFAGQGNTDVTSSSAAFPRIPGDDTSTENRRTGAASGGSRSGKNDPADAGRGDPPPSDHTDSATTSTNV